MAAPSVDSTIPSVDGPESPVHVTFGLVLLHPCDRPTFHAVGSQVVIGRDPSSDVVVDAGQVSRRHLLVRRNGPVAVAEDLGSKNGSFCDGRPFSKIGLGHQSVLRIGEAVAMVWNAPTQSPFSFSELAPGLFGGATLAERVADLREVARSSLPVIVRGATGSGKERVARAIHAWSGRPGEFVGVNCATIPASLADSLLFGHRRGAFTGAVRGEVGYLAAAEGGTLFLDEVVELPLVVQAKLLRALQEREYLPVGETRAVAADVRVVVSTQGSLSEAVDAGRFREDLLARLNGYEVELPLLRERREDIAFLFRHFLAKAFDGPPPALRARVVEALTTHAWPQNVRELESLVARLAVLHAQEPEFRVDHLALPPRSASISGVYDAPDASKTAATPETPVPLPDDLSRLLDALGANDGNVVKAAQAVGISRGRAYRLISAAGIDVEGFRGRRPFRS